MKEPLKHYKSIFISDLHLGSDEAEAEAVNSFLKWHSCDNLFLVGDIIDGWKLRKKAKWPASHSLVIRQIINKVRHGSSVIYLTGNHDEFLRDWLDLGLNIETIEIKNEHSYTAVNGKTYLVVHGDLFDGVHRLSKFISYLGDWAYTSLVKFNRYYNVFRYRCGMNYWSISAYMKSNVKKAIDFIFEFEKTLAGYCRDNKYDGVICGHIHTACIKKIDDIDYMNSGDWVESCTALVENIDGTWEIIHWTKKE